MIRCDALVVGGGPAGSTCAWKLRQAGLDVIVMDRAAFPREKPCAGWITPGVIDALELSPEEYRHGRTLQAITGFRTCRLGDRGVETRFAAVVSYGICRNEFDEDPLRRSGVQVIERMPLTNLRRAGDRWIVNDVLETPLIVGAGGHFCPVARHLGAIHGNEPIVAAQEIEFRMTAAQAAGCPIAPDTPELFLCPDLKGYGWCFRKGDVLNVGLGREDRHQLSGHISRFASALVAAGKLPPGVAHRWKGHAYLLRERSTRRVIDDGVLLAGDAAGLAYLQSGEGIRPAIESGLLAALTILEANGRYRRADLEAYGARLDARFPRARRSRVAMAVPEWLVVALAARLLATAWFTRALFLERWFLRANEPSLTLS